MQCVSKRLYRRSPQVTSPHQSKHMVLRVPRPLFRADTVRVRINGTNVPIDLTNIDGRGTAATNGEDVTTAIMNAVNSRSLGV